MTRCGLVTPASGFSNLAIDQLNFQEVSLWQDVAVLAGSSSSLRASSDPQLSLGTFFVPFFPLYSSLDVSSLLHCSSYTPRIICWDFRAIMTKLLVSGSLNLLITSAPRSLGKSQFASRRVLALLGCWCTARGLGMQRAHASEPACRDEGRQTSPAPAHVLRWSGANLLQF